MSLVAVQTSSTTANPSRAGRRAPAGRIIRSSRLSHPRDAYTEEVVPLATQPSRSSPRGSLPAKALSLVLIGVGALLGSGAINDSSLEAPRIISQESVAPLAKRTVKPREERLAALSVRETARIRATSSDLPFRSLGNVSHKLEVPSVAPVAVRYRERLAAFTTTEPVIEPAVAIGQAAQAPILPARYVPSTGATPQSGSHVTSRVLSIIKKHAPKNRNPKLLAEAIVRESLAQNYDPIFVAAVIKTESLFNPIARSHKGAQGLMQIMPATGAWLANRESLPRQKLTDTRHNLQLGITYLKQLEAEYNGDRVFTLVAYNWGPGHVQMASGGKRRIPGECLRYAVRILNDYRRWKSGVI